MKKEEAEKRAREIVERWDLSIGEGSLKDSIAASLMAGATLGFNHAMALNAVADLKSRWPSEAEVLELCDKHSAWGDISFLVKDIYDRLFPEEG